MKNTTIEFLERYRLDCILYDNINSEIDRLKKIILLKNKNECIASGEIFRLEIESMRDIYVKGKRNNSQQSRTSHASFTKIDRYINKNSTPDIAQRYNENIENAIGNDELCDPMTAIEQRRIQRDIVKERMTQVENSLSLLTKLQKDIILAAVIYKTADISVEDIAERLSIDRQTLYTHKNEALAIIEETII